MKFFIIACLLVASSSALQCNNYAQAIGDMNAVNSVAWRAALRSTGGVLGQQRSQTCNPGEQCVSDVYHYANSNGQQAGLVWTSCWPSNDPVAQHNFHCDWNKQNIPAGNGFNEHQYRCVCKTNHCQTAVDLFSIFRQIYGNI